MDGSRKYKNQAKKREDCFNRFIPDFRPDEHLFCPDPSAPEARPALAGKDSGRLIVDV
jgi:hypothetical protein